MTNRIPTVSVILPNYNHAQFLKQRIDSILNQTYQDFELIILDDHSSDNSISIINEYTNNLHVSHILINRQNSGSPFRQWQKGFSFVKGKYIWIAESDDFASPVFLESMVSLLEKDEKSSLAFCGSHMVDENGEKTPIDWDRNKQREGTISFFPSYDFLFNRMLISNSLYNASMVLFRKSSLQAVNNDFLSFNYTGDWMFFAQICSTGNIYRYNGKLNYFRQHTAKVSPKGDSEGLRYTEGKIVILYTMDKLNLSIHQRKVVIGKQLNDILRFKLFRDESVRQMVLNDLTNYFNAKKYYVTLYRIDKIFNFSGLNLRLNKYI